MKVVPEGEWGWVRRLQRSAALAAAAGLAACASYSGRTLSPGASEPEAVALMGAPTNRYSLPQGERLEYAKGPQGRFTYMLDFDAGGRLVGRDQVLDENHFNAILAGVTGDQVRLAIGRPSHVQGMAFDRTLWSYRYDNPFCQWFQVTLEPDGKVRDTGYGPDPICDRSRFR